MSNTGSRSSRSAQRRAGRNRQIRAAVFLVLAGALTGGISYAAVKHAEPPVDTHAAVGAASPATAAPSSPPAASSFVSTLSAAVMSGRKPVVSTLGSSLTLGNGASKFARIWAYRVELAADAAGVKATWHVNGYHGHTMQEIIAAGGVRVVLSQHPDVILLEAGASNDWGQDTPVTSAVASLSRAVASLRAGAPRALIVFQTGNPVLGGDQPNRVGATLRQYDVAELAWAKAHGLDAFDLYSAFARSLSGKPLAFYLKDKIHPNDAGNALWARLFEQHYRLPVLD